MADDKQVKVEGKEVGEVVAAAVPAPPVALVCNPVGIGEHCIKCGWERGDAEPHITR